MTPIDLRPHGRSFRDSPYENPRGLFPIADANIGSHAQPLGDLPPSPCQFRFLPGGGTRMGSGAAFAPCLDSCGHASISFVALYLPGQTLTAAWNAWFPAGPAAPEALVRTGGGTNDRYEIQEKARPSVHTADPEKIRDPAMGAKIRHRLERAAAWSARERNAPALEATKVDDLLRLFVRAATGVPAESPREESAWLERYFPQDGPEHWHLGQVASACPQMADYLRRWHSLRTKGPLSRKQRSALQASRIRAVQAAAASLVRAADQRFAHYLHQAAIRGQQGLSPAQRRDVAAAYQAADAIRHALGLPAGLAPITIAEIAAQEALCLEIAGSQTKREPGHPDESWLWNQGKYVQSLAEAHGYQMYNPDGAPATSEDLVSGGATWICNHDAHSAIGAGLRCAKIRDLTGRPPSYLIASFFTRTGLARFLGLEAMGALRASRQAITQTVYKQGRDAFYYPEGKQGAVVPAEHGRQTEVQYDLLRRRQGGIRAATEAPEGSGPARPVIVAYNLEVNDALQYVPSRITQWTMRTFGLPLPFPKFEWLGFIPLGTAEFVPPIVTEVISAPMYRGPDEPLEDFQARLHAELDRVRSACIKQSADRYIEAFVHKDALLRCESWLRYRCGTVDDPEASALLDLLYAPDPDTGAPLSRDKRIEIWKTFTRSHTTRTIFPPRSWEPESVHLKTS